MTEPKSNTVARSHLPAGKEDMLTCSGRIGACAQVIGGPETLNDIIKPVHGPGRALRGIRAAAGHPSAQERCAALGSGSQARRANRLCAGKEVFGPGAARGRDQDSPILHDAALLSLGTYAGLRASELLAVTVEALEVQEEGSGLLEIKRFKTAQGLSSGSRRVPSAGSPLGAGQQPFIRVLCSAVSRSGASRPAPRAAR